MVIVRDRFMVTRFEVVTPFPLARIPPDRLVATSDQTLRQLEQPAVVIRHGLLQSDRRQAAASGGTQVAAQAAYPANNAATHGKASLQFARGL